MSVKQALEELVIKHADVIDEADIPWLFESDRWVNLHTFLLLSYNPRNPAEPEQIQAAMSMLHELNLLGIDELAELNTEKYAKNAVTMRYIFEQYGLNEEQAKSYQNYLNHIAKTFKVRYGTIQNFLRNFGRELRQSLVETLYQHARRREDKLDYAISQWLQSILNLPLFVSSPAVEEFCEKHGTNSRDFVNAVDELDLNLSFVTSLLEYDRTLNEISTQNTEE